MLMPPSDSKWYNHAFFVGYNPEQGEGATGFKGVIQGAREKFYPFRKVNNKNMFFGGFIHLQDAAKVAAYVRCNKINSVAELKERLV